MWMPVAADDDGSAVEITYRNEHGEEYVHIADFWEMYSARGDLHSLCWRCCGGDWPGCRKDCPLFAGPVTERLAGPEAQEREPVTDPFSFMLNHECSIDEGNRYVEEFDTLDGTHWEIAVDVGSQLLDMLDEETQED